MIDVERVIFEGERNFFGHTRDYVTCVNRLFKCLLRIIRLDVVIEDNQISMKRIACKYYKNKKNNKIK